MDDLTFQTLPHVVSPFAIATRGQQISPGYKPDVTVVDQNGALRFILECEQKTDRKAFLGDLLKAEVHADTSKSSPLLVIVMKPFPNTTPLQIAMHLGPYKDWLAKHQMGGLNLIGIAVISDSDYLDSIAAGEILGSPEFARRGTLA